MRTAIACLIVLLLQVAVMLPAIQSGSAHPTAESISADLQDPTLMDGPYGDGGADITMAELPRSPFVENRGQIEDESVRFYDGSGGVWFTDEGIWFDIRDSRAGGVEDRDEPAPGREGRAPQTYLDETGAGGPAGVALRISFDGEGPVEPAGVGPRGHVSNFLYGRDPAGWVTGVEEFEEVMYPDVWPGIDLRYYLSEDGLKYDFIIHPGGDPEHIQMDVAGADHVFVDAGGDLVIRTAVGDLIDGGLFIYQEDGDVRHEVDGEFVLTGANSYGFRITGDYDPGIPLVIDPVLHYSTYIGSSAFDRTRNSFIAPDDSVFIIGDTESPGFPTTPGAYQGTYGGNKDAYLCRINATGDELMFSTFIGGSDDDRGYDVTLDAQGNIYITGETSSEADFPLTAGAIDDTYNGGNFDVYVMKLDPTGSNLLYSTYIGGPQDEVGRGINLDGDSNAVVSGETFSSGFPTTNGSFQKGHGGSCDAFLFCLNISVPELVYSTFIGGSADDFGYKTMVDDSGNVTLVGKTESSNFPTTPGAFDEGYNGNQDMFLLCMNSSGDKLRYSTYIGGSQWEASHRIDKDISGNTYISGHSASDDFPVTAGAYDETRAGGWDGVVCLVSEDGGGLLAATFIGGSDRERGRDVKLDPDGNVIFVGTTNSTDFPLTGLAYDTTVEGIADTFICRLDPDLEDLTYSTLIGGEGNDTGMNCPVDSQGRVALLGFTNSTDFPVTTGSYDESYNGDMDIFSCRFVIPDSGGGEVALLRDGSPVIGAFARNGPYTFRVRAYDTAYPDGVGELTLTLDPNGTAIKLRVNTTTGVFTELSDTSDHVTLAGSSLSYDYKNDMWTALFNVTFNWNYPHEDLSDVKVDGAGPAISDFSFRSVGVFSVENDLDLSGSLEITGDLGRSVGDQDAIYPNETLSFGGLIPVYQGTEDVYPPAGEYDIRLWRDGVPVATSSPVPGANVSFNTTGPGSTGPNGTTYSINFTGIPAASDASDVSATLYVKNRWVGFGNNRPDEDVWNTNKQVDVGVTITAYGGGKVDGSTIAYSMSMNNGTNWGNWTAMTHLDSLFVNVSKILKFDDGADNLIRWRAAGTLANDTCYSPPYKIPIDSKKVQFSDYYSHSESIGNESYATVSLNITDATSGVDASTIAYTLSDNSGQSWGPWNKVQGYWDGSSVRPSLNFSFGNSSAFWIKWRADDIAGNGLRESDPQVVNSSAQIPMATFGPKVALLTPDDGAALEANSVVLGWSLIDPGFAGVTYDVYIDTADPPKKTVYADLSKTTLVVEDLRWEKDHYWTVIPTYEGLQGSCVSGVWSFSCKDELLATRYDFDVQEPQDVYIRPGSETETYLKGENLGTSPNQLGMVLDAGEPDIQVTPDFSLPVVVGPENDFSLPIRVAVHDDAEPGDYTVVLDVWTVSGAKENYNISKQVEFTVHVREYEPEVEGGGDGGDGGDGFTVEEEFSEDQQRIFLVAAVAVIVVTATSPWWFLGAQILFIPMMVRHRKDGGDKKWREKIYGAIVSRPGVHFTGLKGWLDVANGTLIYNLEVLIQSGQVVAVRDGFFKKYYPAEEDHFKNLPDDLNTREKIIKVLRSHPGAAQSEIGHLLDLPRQNVYYHLKNMNREGLVRTEKDPAGHSRVYLVENKKENKKPSAKEEGEEDRDGRIETF